MRAGFFRQHKVALLTVCSLPQNTMDKNIYVDSRQELDKFTEDLIALNKACELCVRYGNAFTLLQHFWGWKGYLRLAVNVRQHPGLDQPLV